jgi:hypothetical protein
VTVINQQVVGPYDSVTVRASMGDTLDAWLVANGFAIQPAVEPTIAAYAAAGFDFIALKLAPGEGVGAMQPVRVVTPGSDATLPLRMVAAGVGAHVGIDLWIISEGRYHTQNFPDAVVDFSQLAWDPVQNRSNYTELEQAALGANGGTGWVTEFAQPMATSSVAGEAFVRLYRSSCTIDYQCPSPPADSGVDAPLPTGDASTADADSDADVEAGAGADADTDAAADAATFADGATCAGAMPIDECDDTDVAFTGMHPFDIWITRLRADLPAAALPLGDLSLEANPSQVAVSSSHSTTKYTNPNYNPCPGASSNGSGDGGCACRTETDASSGGGGVWVAMVGFGLLAASKAARKKRARDR